MAIRFNESDIRSMGRTAAGVRAIKLDKKDLNEQEKQLLLRRQEEFFLDMLLGADTAEKEELNVLLKIIKHFKHL